MDIKATVLDVARFLEDKKAGNVTVINVSKFTSITDFFIIADGDVQLQLDSLKNQLCRHLSDQDFRPRNSPREGQNGWVLLDFNDFVIHLFLKETREFYNLESIWGECDFVWPLES